METNLAIEVIGLKKSYKNIEVLRGIDFTVKKGSTFALLGSNGAGKSTTIKIITTLLKFNDGVVKVNGFDLLKQSEKVREQISLTGQNVTVDNILTGRENLQLIAKLRHIKNPEKQINELLKMFNLVDAADRRIQTYSGGMMRKLDLAMSLIGSPSIIFLDEPTTGLDPQARIAMWNIIKKLSKEGVTIFLTTQYLEEADHLADQIAILSQGKIVANGTSGELKKILPHGRIDLSFDNEKPLQLAERILSGYNVKEDSDSLMLSVITDGGIAQISDILNELNKNNVEVTEFAQRLPTLEDVFLTIVKEEK